jgi:hypothetical protein
MKIKPTTQFVLGLIAILGLYSAYHLLVGDNPNWQAIPHIWRQAAKFGVVLAVYASGTVGLGKLPQKWLLQLWHLIHTTLIAVLVGIGLWDFAVSTLPYSFKRLGGSIHEFLISPLLYLATALVGKMSRGIGQVGKD